MQSINNHVSDGNADGAKLGVLAGRSTSKISRGVKRPILPKWRRRFACMRDRIRIPKLGWRAGGKIQAIKWIEAVTAEKKQDASFHEWLKSGVVLCKLCNSIRDGMLH